MQPSSAGSREGARRHEGPARISRALWRLIAVNYTGSQGQCYARLPFADLRGPAVRLKDLMGPASHDRDGSDLVSRGLYLDVPAWGCHVFEMSMR